MEGAWGNLGITWVSEASGRVSRIITVVRSWRGENEDAAGRSTDFILR
jgi:hypothetical protein